MEEKKIKANGLSLLPFLVFILVFLGSGILLQSKGVEMAFYQFPIPVAVFCSLITAFLMLKRAIEERETLEKSILEQKNPQRRSVFEGA